MQRERGKRRSCREQKEQAGFSLPWDRTGPMVEGKAGLVLLKETKLFFLTNMGLIHLALKESKPFTI